MQQITFQGFGQSNGLTTSAPVTDGVVWSTASIIDTPTGKKRAVMMEFTDDGRLLLHPRKFYQNPILAGILGVVGGAVLGMMLKKK